MLRTLSTLFSITPNTEYGKGYVDKIGITELGFGRVSIFYPDEKVWRSYIIENPIEKLMAGEEVELIDETAI